jgi:hypothetical protein
LLVNALVDPDEAAARLPPGVRPHVTDQGTVIGCCLLEIEDLRPAGLPPVVGLRMRAAAHRISAEWDDGAGATVTGVYVPVRHTDARLAVALGGRWFPGVHERAHIEVSTSDGHLRWTSQPVRHPAQLGVRVTVSNASAAGQAGGTCDPVGATCLGASVGVSPDRRGALEAARMQPAHRDAREMVVDELESGFLDTFTTAKPATSYLMCDAEVIWS